MWCLSVPAAPYKRQHLPQTPFSPPLPGSPRRYPHKDPPWTASQDPSRWRRWCRWSRFQTGPGSEGSFPAGRPRSLRPGESQRFRYGSRSGRWSPDGPQTSSWVPLPFYGRSDFPGGLSRSHLHRAPPFCGSPPPLRPPGRISRIQPSASEPWSSYPFFSSSCYFSMESLLKSSKIGAVRMVSAPFT